MKRIAMCCLTGLMVASFGGCPPPAQKLTAADLAIKRPSADVLVVVYSRTGSTARVGLTLAKELNADYIRLQVPKGAGDNYLSAPNRHKQVWHKPKQVDLFKYRLVIIGSPIWFWYPTAYVYSFIRAHDWTGKRVVLYYTFRGGINDNAEREWKSQITNLGGTVVDFFGFNCKKLEGTSLEALAKARYDKLGARWLPPAPRQPAPAATPPAKKRPAARP
jgi:flavodoxin